MESRIARVLLGPKTPERKRIELTPQEPTRYAGTYNPGRAPLTIEIKDGALRLGATTLAPEGDHRFFMPDDPETSLLFELEGTHMLRLVIEREGVVRTARRVPARDPK